MQLDAEALGRLIFAGVVVGAAVMALVIVAVGVGRESRRPSSWSATVPPGGLAARSSPDSAVNPIARVAAGATVKVEEEARGGWARITIGGEPGEWWVDANRLRPLPPDET